MPLLLFQKYPPGKFMYGVATTCSWLGKKNSHYTDLIFNYKCDLDKHLLPQYFRYKKKSELIVMPPHILVRIVVKATQDGRIEKYSINLKLK